MGRGFVAGTLWGALLGVCAIALTSQLMEPRTLSFPRPEAAELEKPAGTEFDQAREETDPVVPAPETAPTEAGDPESPPAPEITETPLADPEPAPEPGIAAGEPDTPEAPEASDATGAVAAAEDTAPSSDVPRAPTANLPPELGPSAGTGGVAQPAPPPEPSETIASPGSGPGAPAAGEVTARLAAPDAGVAPDAPSAAPTSPAVAQTVPPTPFRPGAPETDDGGLAGTGLPQPGFASASGVRVNQLPRIGEEATDAPDPEEVAAEDDPDAPALVRYAADFDNPDGGPIIAVILLHDGDAPAPGALDFPVSFAVRAADPAAAETAAAYRDAGREIVLIPALPPGAAPRDVEVALMSNFDAVPEAVALMDEPGTGFQSERTAIAQVVAVLNDTGQGLVTFPRGLNTALQLAERAELPARLVFRELDANGEDAGEVRRALDRAAFRARQEGVIVLVGRARPETIEALEGWAADNAGDTLRLAPISAALLAR